jgi:putative PIN family toxin of toxin-antitoxin system
MSQLRVVLDTNVVLSSLLFRSGRLSQLRHGWQGKRFVSVVCSQTMAELVRVMGYKKFKLSQSDVTAILALYIPYVEVHTLTPSTESLADTPQCRDSKDQIFLDLAHSAQVNCLVTGDADLLVLDDPQLQHISFNICTPLNFLNRLETSL